MNVSFIVTAFLAPCLCLVFPKYQCGCKGKGKACGEGCNCTNCTNTDCCTTSAATNGTEDASIEEIVTDALPEDLDEIMEWVVYMKKHGSGFNGKTPEAYFNQSHQQGQTTLQHHQQWLDNIRQCIWDRIEFENEMIPNTDALYRHWTRVCWVLDMWSQADRNTMAPKPVSEYGWKIIEGTLAFDWDSDSNMDAIRERVAGLLKGCGCKTGCQTRHTD